MPKGKTKKTIIKNIYLDTSTILDYLLNREDNAVLLLSSIKKRKWKIITSTFTMMEIADWKKRDLFMRNKQELKWDMDKIFSHKNETDLTDYEFTKVQKWLLSQEELMKIDFIELEKEAWIKAREISSDTNLLAKDVLHFSTAFAAALHKECDIIVTSDGMFKKEAELYLKKKKKLKILKVLLLKEFVEKYTPK